MLNLYALKALAAIDQEQAKGNGKALQDGSGSLSKSVRKIVNGYIQVEDR